MIARLALVAAALAAWGFFYAGAAAQGRNASPKDTVTDEGLSASAVGDEDEEQDDNEEDEEEESEEDDNEEEEDDDGDDEEDEDAPSSPWTFSGVITRALLPWNDGAKR